MPRPPASRITRVLGTRYIDAAACSSSTGTINWNSHLVEPASQHSTLQDSPRPKCSVPPPVRLRDAVASPPPLAALGADLCGRARRGKFLARRSILDLANCIYQRRSIVAEEEEPSMIIASPTARWRPADDVADASFILNSKEHALGGGRHEQHCNIGSIKILVIPYCGVLALSVTDPWLGMSCTIRWSLTHSLMWCAGPCRISHTVTFSR